MKILLVQGANMEYLGKREPELYGTTTAKEMDQLLENAASALKQKLEICYTNVEGQAISWIYEAEQRNVEGLIMNPAGFLFAGYALRECLKSINLPYIEVHMTNIDRRGMHSVTACEASGMITGLGIESYLLALSAIRKLIDKKQSS